MVYPTVLLRLTLLDYSDWSAFNQHIAKVQLEDAPLAGMRAQGVLKPLLLRRTKDATIDGQPILELPAKQVDLIELEFSPEEREVPIADCCKEILSDTGYSSTISSRNALRSRSTGLFATGRS